MTRAIPVLIALLSLSLAGDARGHDYHVGPTQPIPTPDRVPWARLRPGDRVLIHWRPQPYRAKWVICTRGEPDRPIVVSGVTGEGDALPVIDAANAIAPTNVDFWSEERAVIKIGPARGSGNVRPGHIVIENLEICGVRPGNFYISRNGINEYSDAASPIYIERGDDITVRNCIFRDSANGFFTAHDTSRILLESCFVYDNGMPESYYQHNAYTESAGMVYQGNRFGPLREGCFGNNIKDRSAGLVVRANWIEGGNRQLDLVDAEDSDEIRDRVDYDSAFVYGNVLIETEDSGNNQVVHFGGDNGPPSHFRKGPLYFFHNTVVSQRGGTTTLLRLSSNEVTAQVFCNVLYTDAPGHLLAILDETGVVNLAQNWLKPDWRGSHGPLNGVIRPDNNIEGDFPGFLDVAAGDLRLDRQSICRDGSPDQLLAPQVDLIEFERPRGLQLRAVHGRPDLGAFEYTPSVE